MKDAVESKHLWIGERKYHKARLSSVSIPATQWRSTKEMPAAHHSLQGATMHSYCTDFLHSLTDSFSVIVAYFHLFPSHPDEFVAHIQHIVHKLYINAVEMNAVHTSFYLMCLIPIYQVYIFEG